MALGYTEELALAEANRCLHCKVPHCREGCPVDIDIPAFIAKIKEGDFEGANTKIKEASSLPAICERICPQENQDEKYCVMGIKGKPAPVAINTASKLNSCISSSTVNNLPTTEFTSIFSSQFCMQ